MAGQVVPDGRPGAIIRPYGTPLIIVGFDGSSSSQHALAFAAGVALRMRGSLLVVYVVGAIPMSELTPLAVDAGDTLRESEIEAVHDLAAEIVGDLGSPWSFRAETGEAAAELDRLANELGADVVVTGRSRFPARHILGSVPARLARHARCPITVVP